MESQLIKDPKAKPKKRYTLTKGAPLPLTYNTSGALETFKGVFNGFSVVISDVSAKKRILLNGFFGKANLSRNYPSFDSSTAILRQRQFAARKKYQILDSNKKKVLIVPDSDSDDENDYLTNLQPNYEIDNTGFEENVYLNPCEALFLSHDLKCLDILIDNTSANIETVWETLLSTSKHFVQDYAVFNYYRSRNWVVKSGIKFGGDFILYKDGPPFYHASYVVIIDVLNEELTRQKDMVRRSMELTHLAGLNRLCETAGKELLIVQVIWPRDLEKITINDIKTLKINEVLVKRWM